MAADLMGVANANDGMFDYEFFRGTLTFTVTGTDGAGCTWSGIGTYNPSMWSAWLNTVFGDGSHYGSQAGIAPTFNFPATISCPDGQGPAAIMPTQFGIGRWLDTGPLDLGLDDPGVDRLSGHYTDQRSVGATSYTWDLEARPLG